MTRGHLTIGEVLSLLREEFSDLSITKIRFLESQGLVDPERTPSGYRKFYEHDVERLRWILRQQRENFLPLKVIRGRLGDHEPAVELDEDALAFVTATEGPGAAGHEPAADHVLAPPDPPRPVPPAAAPASQIVPQVAPATAPVREPEAASDETSVEVDSYTASELAAAAGVETRDIAELERFGLLEAGGGIGGGSYYDTDALEVVRLSAAFAHHGVEARHLRAWKTAAERETSLFEQVIVPLLRQRNPQARRQALAILDELARYGAELRAALVRQALRKVH